MTAEEIKAKIAEDLRSEKDLKNVSGLDLTICLIEPVLQNYQYATDSSKNEELWTVLEETPDGNGYKIYFDPATGMFGLGMKSNRGQLIDIGSYGSFLETIYSM